MSGIIFDTSYAKTLQANLPSSESEKIQATIDILKMQPHIEGGYFVETDRQPERVPNPFKDLPTLSNATDKADTSETRNASTSINYLLTPKSPVGYFHRNRGHTVHTLHKGRAVYVTMYPDRPRDKKGRVQVNSFLVGQDLVNGEDLQWCVGGGVFKATFLYPDEDEGHESKDGMLISETVVPGFEYTDHDFLTAEGFVELLDQEQQEQLQWLLRPDQQARLEEVRKGK